MKLTIVYDNEVVEKGLESGWGFSCYIEKEGFNLLFDTGWDGNVLLSNLNSLKINVKKIEAVFLSHPHWDHIGGLPGILALNPNLTVYIPKSFGMKLKEEIAKRANVVEITESFEFVKGCISTGELGSHVVEQSLIIKSGKGLVVVTGCAHPKLKNILQVAQDYGKIYALVGGFHGFKEYDLLRKIPIIVPCHCTFHKREIRNIYQKAYTSCGSGKKIII